MSLRSPAPARDEREAIRAAAAWYARLASGKPDDALRQAWSGWLAASELHRQAWQRVEAVCGQFGQLPGPLAGPALRGVSGRRRAILNGLLLLGAAAPLAWQLERSQALGSWQAAQQTRVGERRPLSLADGSLLVMDTDSALDLAFDARQRLIHLHQGRILVTTAGASRLAAEYRDSPLRVRTRHGEVEALGTRFVVRTGSEASQVAVLEARVRVTPAAGSRTGVLLEAGQQLDFGIQEVGDARRAAPAASAWTDGSLVAVDMPLGQWVAELGRYRRGILRCDPAIAGLRVSGAYPLDDTDQALRMLVDTFPVRSVLRTRYWVSIEAA
ncbi:FecR domain-containing protein [Zoogloea dura]|jgi:transmembrane sensor|nr:FecR domain-containing protein [Zoogloea dura]